MASLLSPTRPSPPTKSPKATQGTLSFSQMLLSSPSHVSLPHCGNTTAEHCDSLIICCQVWPIRSMWKGGGS